MKSSEPEAALWEAKMKNVQELISQSHFTHTCPQISSIIDFNIPFFHISTNVQLKRIFQTMMSFACCWPGNSRHHSHCLRVSRQSGCHMDATSMSHKCVGSYMTEFKWHLKISPKMTYNFAFKGKAVKYAERHTNRAVGYKCVIGRANTAFW